jgi:hypothetical protein
MKAAMIKKQPHKIDIGAVFNLPPKDHLAYAAGAFKTVEVFSFTNRIFAIVGF